MNLEPRFCIKKTLKGILEKAIPQKTQRNFTKFHKAYYEIDIKK